MIYDYIFSNSGSREQWGWYFFIEEIKNFAFFQTRKFSKNVKKIHENFKEILRFFENFLKFYRNFRENLGENLENFRNLELPGVRGA